MWSIALEVRVRRANPQLAVLADLIDQTTYVVNGKEYRVADYLGLSARPGDLEQVVVAPASRVGRITVPALRVNDLMSLPNEYWTTAREGQAWMLNAALTDPAVRAITDTLTDANLRDWYNAFRDYVNSRPDAAQFRQRFRQQLIADFVKQEGLSHPEHAVTQMNRRVGARYPQIAESLTKLEFTRGLSDEQLASAIRHTLVGDTAPMDAAQAAVRPRSALTSQRNLLAALGHLLVVVEGSRHPTAMLTNAMNLVVGEQGRMGVDQVVQEYNPMWYDGATEAAASLENRLYTDPGPITDELPAAIAQTERASLARYLQLVLDPPAGRPRLAVADNPLVDRIRELYRAGDVDQAYDLLTRPGNLRTFLRATLQEIIAYTTTNPRPEEPT
jgi:hypothetical protein